MTAGLLQDSSGTAIVGGGFQLLGIAPGSGFNPEGASLEDILNAANMLTVSNSMTTIEAENPGLFYKAGLLTFWSNGSTIAGGTQLYALASTSSTFDLNAPWALVTGTDVGWFSPVPTDPFGFSGIELSFTGNIIIAAGNGGPGVGAYFNDTPGTTTSAVDANLTLTVQAGPDYLDNGRYDLAPGVKVKLGIDRIEGARYQWFKGRVAVKAATGPVLDLTPGILNFGPPQAGFYQLRVTEVGKPAKLLGPWIITCDDPTVLVYNLNARGTETDELEPTESPLVLGGFLLLQPQSQEVTLIMTRTIGKGRNAIRTFWVEQRPDASINSNGPVPGTPRMKASRTVVACLGGTEYEELLSGALYGLTGDRDVLWLSGPDAIIRLHRPNIQYAVVAPSRMTGFMGTLIDSQSATQIGNLNVTASINLPQTKTAFDDGWTMNKAKGTIAQLLERQGFNRE